jgi:rhodanese-related sulfurtransferase
VKLGYTNVKVYPGGLLDWIRRRYPVIRTVNYPKADIPEVFPEQVYKNPAKVVILDIGGEPLRQIGEFKQGNVVHIPLDDLEEKYPVLPKDKKIVIVDVKGKQEDIAGRFLTLKGYRNLAKMAGGGRAWFKTVRVNEMEKKNVRKK